VRAQVGSSERAVTDVAVVVVALVCNLSFHFVCRFFSLDKLLGGNNNNNNAAPRNAVAEPAHD
jgi:hypothetical protein